MWRERMLLYYLLQPYNSKCYYLLSGTDRVGGRTETDVWRVRREYHSPKTDRGIFGSPQSRCPGKIGVFVRLSKKRNRSRECKDTYIILIEFVGRRRSAKLFKHFFQLLIWVCERWDFMLAFGSVNGNLKPRHRLTAGEILELLKLVRRQFIPLSACHLETREEGKMKIYFDWACRKGREEPRGDCKTRLALREFSRREKERSSSLRFFSVIPFRLAFGVVINHKNIYSFGSISFLIRSTVVCASRAWMSGAASGRVRNCLCLWVKALRETKCHEKIFHGGENFREM